MFTYFSKPIVLIICLTLHKYVRIGNALGEFQYKIRGMYFILFLCMYEICVQHNILKVS